MRLYLDSCVLIDALDGAEQLRRRTLQQLERYADADWVISDLVCMECLVGPLRSADQNRPLAFRRFFSDCSVVPLHSEVMERASGRERRDLLSTELLLCSRLLVLKKPVLSSAYQLSVIVSRIPF
jgi:predicted nucleic acid-binding protein